MLPPRVICARIGETIWTVSYTHLDVYKRQWQGCAALCARLPGLLSTLAEPLQRLHAAALHLASRLRDGMGEAAAQWVDRLFAGGSVVADSVSQGVFGLSLIHI